MTEADRPSPEKSQPRSEGNAVARKMRCSIKAKLLTALLALSILPLLICTILLAFSMMDVQTHVKSELLRLARTNFVRLARDQASIANAMLDKIKTETHMVAYSAQLLLSNPKIQRRDTVNADAAALNDAQGKPMFILAPGVNKRAVRSEMQAISRLDRTFRMIRDADAALDDIFYCSKSGICRRYPGKAATLETEFTDFDIHAGYVPSARPWYIDAVGRNGVAWTKYANSWRGKLLLALDPVVVGKIGTAVSPALARAFAGKQIGLVQASPILEVRPGEWQLQDRNGKHYVLLTSRGWINVYGVDILTCSLAVTAPDGRLQGVVGLDISMEAISHKIIHTPDEVPGNAFLLNEHGVLIEQERLGMSVPGVGSDIRNRMVAGETGIAFDAASAAWVAFAPIPSIRSADGKAYWSLGVSVPESDIVRVVREIQMTMVKALELLAVIFLAVAGLVVAASFRVSKCITRPILALDKGAARIGDGELDYRIEVRTNDEVEQLADTFNKMAADLKAYIKNLKETTAEKERFESELRVAHEIQMNFLKKIFPPFPERDDLSLYATIEPAREVGGDLFDFSFLDEHRLVFYVGDVSDKGVPAALVMAMTTTLMKRASHQPGATPAKILREVNAALSEDNQNAMFVTLFIGILDSRSGELFFSNAGHNPPLILSADGACRYLDLPDGLVLGVTPNAAYIDAGTHLAPGDMIVTYTDGVTEAMSPERALYSEERLQQTLAAQHGNGVEEVVTAIIASVKAHAAGAAQSDDITILSLKRNMQT